MEILADTCLMVMHPNRVILRVTCRSSSSSASRNNRCLIKNKITSTNTSSFCYLLLIESQKYNQPLTLSFSFNIEERKKSSDCRSLCVLLFTPQSSINPSPIFQKRRASNSGQRIKIDQQWRALLKSPRSILICKRS